MCSLTFSSARLSLVVPQGGLWIGGLAVTRSGLSLWLQRLAALSAAGSCVLPTENSLICHSPEMTEDYQESPLLPRKDLGPFGTADLQKLDNIPGDQLRQGWLSLW